MKATRVLGLLLALAIGVLLLAPFLGMKTISFQTLLHPSAADTDTIVFWQIRLPRVLTSFLAGAALALSGMAFQALFRNPLATPYTLGVSSGASLGAVIGVRLGLAFSVMGIPSTSIFGFAGALFSILLVYGLTSLRPGLSSSTLLLAGVTIGFFFSSLILAIQYSANEHDSFMLLRWMIGGVGMVGYDAVLNILPFAIGGAGMLYLLIHELNLLTTGEDLALSRGVNVPRVKRHLFFAASLMVGGVVAVCGPIGFVGMMVPHMCRLMVGSDHRHLFPATLLLGGILLMVCDLVARTIAAPSEVPVGVITALLGGPFFLWLLIREKGETSFV